MTSSFYLVGVIVNEFFKDHTYKQTHIIQNSIVDLNIVREKIFPSTLLNTSV